MNTYKNHCIDITQDMYYDALASLNTNYKISYYKIYILHSHLKCVAICFCKRQRSLNMNDYKIYVLHQHIKCV